MESLLSFFELDQGDITVDCAIIGIEVTITVIFMIENVVRLICP